MLDHHDDAELLSRACALHLLMSFHQIFLATLGEGAPMFTR